LQPVAKNIEKNCNWLQNPVQICNRLQISASFPIFACTVRPENDHSQKKEMKINTKDLQLIATRCNFLKPEFLQEIRKTT